MSDDVIQAALAQHLARREIWSRKPAIRACYEGWYARLRPYITAGPSIEVGAGSCGIANFWPGLLNTDVVPSPFINFASDAMRLPIADASVGNIVCIDVLHHLQNPHLLFEEASRVLRPGGRILAVEPYITPASYLGYKLMHHEDVWFKNYQKPQHGDDGETKEDPWQGNLAMANVLFSKEEKDWPRRHPQLRILVKRKFGLFDFQLAGGFKPYAFVGNPSLYRMFQALDRALDPLGVLLAFRVLIVIERTSK